MNISISNKLVDYTIVYDDRREVNSGKYQHKKDIIDEIIQKFKSNVEARVRKEVVVVYDWRKTHSGMEIILYAYEF